MSMIGGVGSIALAMVLVGSAVIARYRGGQPVLRHALIWAAILAVAFAVALAIDGHGHVHRDFT